MSRTRSISVPIALGAVTVALTIALLVAWIVVILQNNSLSQVSQNTWLLVAGVLSLGVIMTVLVLFSVFLVRETLEIRRQDTFIDSVTHELKSPLASIKLCLQTIDRPELNPEQGRALKQMMLDDVERLTLFINEVLQASRLAHGGHQLAVASFDVAQLVHESVAQVCKRYRLPADTVALTLAEGVQLHSDRTALGTVLVNLLDNAIKYSEPPYQVRLQVAVQGDRLVVCVSDQGIGLGPRHLKRIFERFYRVPIEAVRARRGTGLGLFVVASHVRALGGRIQAASKGRGAGSEFTVSLPLAGNRNQR